MKYLASKKDKRKLIRSIIQLLILLFLAGILLKSTISFKEYENYDGDRIDQEGQGFVALSYFAVDREGDRTMISTERLEEHFQALKENGYISLSQADLKAYYDEGRQIPPRSFFLMFEDGRRDTAIFASPLLERFNFIATIFTYGNKFGEKDPKFLSPRDLRGLERGSFWERGSNGYRLAYINVYDRYDNFLGELHSDEFSKLKEYIGRDYNHYLMDFIRDERKIPRESYDQMQDRIEGDYKLMERVYKEELGELPQVYALMHSNTGQFASNKNVSAINERAIKEYFAMNFNREGYSFNRKDGDIYDLTRMQPQPYWYPNHLLMRIKADTGESIRFMEGDGEVRKDWDIIQGAGEFRKSSIIVTSEPESIGLVRLNKTIGSENFSLHTRLRGNILGSQGIYLRSDKDMEDYIKVGVKNNQLYVGDREGLVYTLDLNLHDEIDFPSLEEDRQEALDAEYKLYAKNIRKKTPTRMEEQVKDRNLQALDRGEEDYIREFQINDMGNRQLAIHVNNHNLTIYVDDKLAAEDLALPKKIGQYIFLESAWGEYGYSQRNLADDVYDGVFEDLIIEDLDREDQILYSNKLEGWELLVDKIAKQWGRLINWFIRNL